ncbi:MAG: hypothetical protein GY861_20760 [bacterium]|nr:hypothetical protein [bacterium]
MDGYSTFHERKAARKEFFFKWIYGWKLENCSCCSGSGRYAATECSWCNGTGKEWHKPQEQGENNV